MMACHSCSLIPRLVVSFFDPKILGGGGERVNTLLIVFVTWLMQVVHLSGTSQLGTVSVLIS